MRLSIRIENLTRYRTRDLRRFAVRCAREVFEDHPHPRALWHLWVTFRYSRGHHSGVASIGGAYSTVRLPRPGSAPGVNKRKLALVLVHEFGHNAGLRHAQMKGSRWQFSGDWCARYAWADALPLEVKPEPVVIRPSGLALAEHRRARIAERLAGWLTREKRARTTIRRLRRQLGYYDRRMAALRAGVTSREATP